jgi:hypothetical protein
MPLSDRPRHALPPTRRSARAAVLADLGILATAGGLIGNRFRALGLSDLDRTYDLLGCRIVGGSRFEQELEQNGPLELLNRIGHLVTRSSGRIPFRDDHLGMRHPDPKWGRTDLAFPDDVTLFHAVFLTPFTIAAP